LSRLINVIRIEIGDIMNISTRLSFCVSLLLIASVPLMAQTSTMRLRGVIEERQGSELKIKISNGEHVSLTLASPFSVSAVVKRSLSDIKVGDFIGAGARPQADGTFKAIQVVIFPEAQRGTGEGHRDWGVLPETTMTNATVAESVGSVDGSALVLRYKDGEKKITIGADATIVTLMPAQPDEVKVGTEMVTTASKDSAGHLTSARITIGKDGVAPPL
jgi:hypothetical protein